MSVKLTYDLSAIDRLNRRIERLADMDRRALLKTVGAAVETQTRRRLKDEKRGPDGTAWDAWSDDYAASRHGGQSFLVGERDLLDSIDNQIDGDQVEIGSNLVYARVHQEGSANDSNQNIPARPYLGLSDDNEEALADTIDAFFEGILQ